MNKETNRPKLNIHIDPNDFLSFYWLKEELINFLREHKISTSGSKQILTERVSQFLKTGTKENRNVEKSTQRTRNMPGVFARQSIIGEGWRCSQELRAFFEKEIGKHFHFDDVMRNIIYNGAGKTLNEAIEIWKQEHQKPAQEKIISSQFEYNRHIREYFKTHPGSTLKEAIQEWNIKKKERREI